MKTNPSTVSDKLIVPETPNKIQIGIQDGYCNLRCPMCLLHSNEIKNGMHGLKGKMPFKNVCKILDEIKDARPAISPYRWSEPLVIKDFKQYIMAIKERKLPVVINTNGLLLKKDLAEFMVDIKFDSVTFSIDAMTKETLKKLRGIDEIEKLKDVVFLMLEARGGLDLPRIGVSFALGAENINEKDRFVSYWLEFVDVVRITKMYMSYNEIHGLEVISKRVPCNLLYGTMVIDYKGDVPLCCIDVEGKTIMGNVFEQGVKKVWLGKAFERARYYHETAQYDKISICKDCKTWSDYKYEETIVDGILIRESPIMTFYNRIDRLNTWQK